MSERAEHRSRSDFINVRGLRYHVRRWGVAADRAAAHAGDVLPQLFLCHGWLDVGGTFDPLVQALLAASPAPLEVLAPDWRGFGHTAWPQDGYWFYDYVADIEAIVDHYSPDAPVLLAGHSMGGQAVSLYAGLRPRRVQQLVLLDSLFLPDMPPQRAPTRFRKWLDQLREPLQQKTYDSFEQLAQRVRRSHPRLTPERALFVAQCWGREDGHGRISLCADPKHRLSGPGLYRAAESEAVWREVLAPTLFIDSGESEFAKSISAEELARRRGCFRDHQQVCIAGAGHMLHFDAPEATAAAIAAFLRPQPARAQTRTDDSAG
ncbi:MAG: alpha/beta hydrolase [Nevskia sp.]|nr:alpha/beta hydrolase [Nevskia sp.]